MISLEMFESYLRFFWRFCEIFWNTLKIPKISENSLKSIQTSDNAAICPEICWHSILNLSKSFKIFLNWLTFINILWMSVKSLQSLDIIWNSFKIFSKSLKIHEVICNLSKYMEITWHNQKPPEIFYKHWNLLKRLKPERRLLKYFYIWRNL